MFETGQDRFFWDGGSTVWYWNGWTDAVNSYLRSESPSAPGIPTRQWVLCKLVWKDGGTEEHPEACYLFFNKETNKLGKEMPIGSSFEALCYTADAYRLSTQIESEDGKR